MAPERRENLKRPAGFVLNSPRLIKERGIEAFRFDPGFAQGLLDLGIAFPRHGFITAIPVNRAATGFSEDVAQRVQRRPDPDDEPRTHLLQMLLEGGEGMMQPPPRGGARRPRALLLRRPDKQGNHGSAAIEGRRQGGIVLQPQVLAEPDKGRGQTAWRSGRALGGAVGYRSCLMQSLLF